MCSIMGTTGYKILRKGNGFERNGEETESCFRDGFSATVSRGPDDTRVIDTGCSYLGFHRLAIMGLNEEGMQPFEKNGSYVVCNGEIYGFRKLKDELISCGYEFKSDSDCEIILPLFEKYGVSMFGMLDAEFAMIIYDAKTGRTFAARDPIGIRPLYYCSYAGEYIFASEPKNLISYGNKIYPFPPGHYFDGDQFIQYRDIARVTKVCHDSIENICASIREKLIKGITKRLDSDAPVGFLLSGGLDSSLVCSVAAKASEKPIKTFAIGMESDAIDLKYAKEVAEFIGSEHTEVIITKEDVINALPELIHLLGTYDITTIRASVGMYLLCKSIHENTDVRVLLTGEISDELFGYKYTDFAPSAEAFQKEAEKRIHEIHMYDVLRADRCISVNSLEARVPFGDLDFVSYVMSIDPEMKLNKYQKGKYLLRHAFEGDYLPHDILYREKAAFSDAVGHSMVDYIKAYAEDVYTDSEAEEKYSLYSSPAPFTKESLMYREIFEKFYPGQSQMVTDYWMPNKEWEGCNVNDPSARVLSNYGDSGK